VIQQGTPNRNGAIAEFIKCGLVTSEIMAPNVLFLYSESETWTKLIIFLFGGVGLNPH
jgi:hypothetical protein